MSPKRRGPSAKTETSTSHGERTSLSKTDAASAARAHDDASGVGRLVDLARGAGNRAIESVLGRTNESEPSGASGLASRLGARLGVDTSSTTVRDDADAKAIARSVHARAVTIGDTILLGDQAPSLATPDGERLLAHELAHVAQQRNAGGHVRNAMSTVGDAHERAADTAASRAVHGESASPIASGAPAAVQREDLSITKRFMLTRDDAKLIVRQYLERVQGAQGGKAVSVTDEVKTTLRLMFQNDMAGSLRFDAFTKRTVFPGSADDLANEIVQYLPEEIDPQRLAHLATAGQPQPTTTIGRLKSLAEKTAPAQTDEQQIAEWKFGQMTKEARVNDKGVVGPFGVDVNRLFNIGKGLGEAISPTEKKKQPAAPAPNPALDALVSTLDRDALVPVAARGTENAGNYADAQEFARIFARQLDAAQAAGKETLPLPMDPSYSGAKDKERIIEEIARIVRLVRDALPHKASKVEHVDLYFGERLARRITLADEPAKAP